MSAIGGEVNFLTSRQTCRCGATFPANDTIALVNHVTSDDHTYRLAALGIVEHNHSERFVDAAGRPVEETYPGAQRYFRGGCPACERDQVAAPVRVSEERRATYCECGEFVLDSSGDAGCGNCGADYGPADRYENREGDPAFNSAFDKW